jgi:nitroreductase
MLENKRRSLVGEGFEDVLAAVIRRENHARVHDVRVRSLLHDLPSFNRARRGDKPNKVDLAILQPRANKRTLVTAKWSLRADREKQFAQEFAEYVSSESNREPFEYVFVTNEFDPARLVRACESLAGNAPMFTHVVHINPEALKATYGQARKEETIGKVFSYIDSKRLISLNQWVALLAT